MSERWMAALGVGVLCLLASACSTGGPSKSASGTTTTVHPKRAVTIITGNTTSTTTTTTTPASVTPSTTAAAAGAGVPLCAGASVGVSGKEAPAAAGHLGVILLFVNDGTASCVLYGYPGVAGLNAGGAQLVQARRSPSGMLGGLGPGNTTIPRVTLSAGQTASAVVEGTDVPTGTEPCASYPSLLVTPPNTRESVRIPWALPGCQPIQVHPVVPGTSGSAQS
jgi:hypothetical protein